MAHVPLLSLAALSGPGAPTSLSGNGFVDMPRDASGTGRVGGGYGMIYFFVKSILLLLVVLVLLGTPEGNNY